MGTYLSIFYHIVFSTKKRVNSLKDEHQKRIYSYIWQILKDKKCKLIRIGGTENHIHILFFLHPEQALSDLMRKIKSNSTVFIKQNIDVVFMGWQKGYSAMTCNEEGKNAIVNYIKNQKTHHQKITFEEEIKNLLKSSGIEFKDKYLFEDE